MLASVLIIGYLFPLPGREANNLDFGGICFNLRIEDDEICVYRSLSQLFVSIIFLLSGIKLKTDEIKSALKEWKAVIFGIISILTLAPCLTFWMITWPFKEEQFAIGLTIFFSQGTTLSSGVIIVGQALGNVPMALLLTVTTNIIAVLTMPLFISTTLENFSDVEVSISSIPIILQLCSLIIVPLAIGKVLRFFKLVKKFATRFKLILKLAASSMLSLIVWMNISNSQEDLKKLDIASIGLLFAAGLVIHLFLLAVNFSFAQFVLRLKDREKRAVVICTSQKTLPVSLAVLELFDENDIGSKALIIIPMIISHFVQIVCDAFLASYWAAKEIDDLISIPDDDLEPNEVNKDNNSIGDDTEASDNEVIDIT